MKRYAPKKLAKEPGLVPIDEKTLADCPEIPEITMKQMQEEAPVGGGGGPNLPIVSVGTAEKTDIIYVRFDSEPVEKQKNDGTPIAYAEVTLLKDHGVFDREKDDEIPGTRGAKVCMNLKRHAILWKYAQHFMPLKGKSFAIANVGKIQVKKGKAVDYRWKSVS